VTFPGLIIFVTVLALNMVEAGLNPCRRQR
jgi:hypothetical protein